MQVSEIPLSPNSQTLSVALAGVTYQLTLIWRDPAGWFLDIAAADKTPILNGIPLVTGCDLLAQYAYLGIGGSLVVQTDNNPGAAPTYANLGQASHLYFVTQ